MERITGRRGPFMFDTTRECPCARVDNLDDALWARLPVVRVLIRGLTLSQPGVSIAGVAEADPATPVRVVRHGDVLHLVNGHHRLLRAWLEGARGLNAQIYRIQENAP